ILMPNVKIGDNVVIENAIIAENTVIGDNSYIGFCPENSMNSDSEVRDKNITVIGENLVLPAGYRLEKGSMIDVDNYQSFQTAI
ncbi:MAG: hypothetical protein H6Q59_2622, partial [Firmicutes bacterium]|nr:hypothetical protein [Bacillota bacterium]